MEHLLCADYGAKQFDICCKFHEAGGSILPILQMRKLRHREVKELAPDLTGGKWHSWV